LPSAGHRLLLEIMATTSSDRVHISVVSKPPQASGSGIRCPLAASQMAGRRKRDSSDSSTDRATVLPTTRQLASQCLGKKPARSRGEEGKATQPCRSQAKRGQHESHPQHDATPNAATNPARVDSTGPVPRAGRSWGAVERPDTSASLLQGQAVAATIRASILAQNPLMMKY
jgi:hypothetical protein